MAVTEADRKANTKLMTLYMAIVIGIIGGYFVAYACGVQATEGETFFDGLRVAVGRITTGKLMFPLSVSTFLGFFVGGGLIGAIVYFLMSIDNQKHYHHKEDEVGGTGGFMERKEMNAYNEKYITKDPAPITEGLPIAYNPKKDQEMYSQNMIMSKNFCRPMNSRKLIGNNNVLIVGGAGTGKSRFVIKPNVLQMNASYVITDPSGEMIYSLGKVLKEHGYKIKIFNISDMKHSNCYNPLAYIRDEAGVKMLIECLINNTTKGEAGGDNQFFVDAEQLLYSACIFYLKDFCYDDSKKNFAGVMSMINASSVNEMDPNSKSPLDLLFDELPHNSLAWKYYKAFKQAAGKTLKSIIISCVTRLQPFLIPQVVNLTKTDDLHLEKMGEEKTALFIITPQADRTYSFLASMLYHQLFETLYFVAEKKKAETGNEMLDIPVRCMMDEFANCGEVPDFPSRLATMRKYNISATIALQNISQIESMYEDDWKTLVGNCSTIIFLGSQEPEVLKYFSEMLGKMTIRVRSEGLSNGSKSGSNQNYQSTAREVMTAEELGRLPSDECIVFTQNMRAVRDKKYVYENHPYYPQTADDNDELGFKYQNMSIYDNTKTGFIESLIKAKAEAARYHRDLETKRTPKDPSKMDLSGNPVDELNNVSLGETEDEKLFRNFIEEAVTQGASRLDDPVCAIVLDGMPTKYLVHLIKQVSVRLKKPAVVVFSDTADSEDDLIIGVGIDHNHKGLADAMENQFSKKVGVKNGIIYTAIQKKAYPDYVERVNNAFVQAASA